MAQPLNHPTHRVTARNRVVLIGQRLGGIVAARPFLFVPFNHAVGATL